MEKDRLNTELFAAINDSADKMEARRKAECKLDRAKKLLKSEYDNEELEYLKTTWVSKIAYFLWGTLSIALATGVIIAIFYAIIWVIMKLS